MGRRRRRGLLLGLALVVVAVAVMRPAVPPAPASHDRRLPVGLVAGSDFAKADSMDLHARLGGTSLRVEVAVRTDPRSLRPVFKEFAAHGIRPLVLVGFGNRFPQAHAVEELCSGLAGRFGPAGSTERSRKLALRRIEFGNETSYAYLTATHRNPERYARLLAVCARAARRADPAVGVLGVADDPTGARWVDRMFAAVPELDDLVRGWTSHPYGPPGRADRILDGVRDATQANGSTKPIFVTEWGLATDDGARLTGNYGWPGDMTYRQAARALLTTLRRWRTKYPRLAGVWYYQATDQRPSGATREREHYFGVVRRNGRAKGALTSTALDLFRSGVREP